jgi:hypothetical protein
VKGERKEHWALTLRETDPHLAGPDDGEDEYGGLDENDLARDPRADDHDARRLAAIEHVMKTDFPRYDRDEALRAEYLALLRRTQAAA